MNDKLSRRAFLSSSTAGAAALALAGCAPRAGRSFGVPPMPVDVRKVLAAVALEAAAGAGATYADIRINRYQTQSVSVRTQRRQGPGALKHVPAVRDRESFGFGVRVLAGGAWGFAASHLVTRDEVVRVARLAVEIAKANATLREEPVRLCPTPAYQARYQTPVAVDPFAISIEEKLLLFRDLTAQVMSVPKVFLASVQCLQRLEDRFFASSEGSLISQQILQVTPSMRAVAVEPGRRSKSRTYRPSPVTAGWEAVTRARFPDHARRVGEEAVAHLAAPSVAPGVKDLVLLPTHLGLTIHESIGHSTELDRALGWEANLAGTSFLTPQKLGRERIGSALCNFVGDRTRPEMLSTCGWDDDGVKTREFPIVTGGLFVGFQTTRDQAHYLGQNESMGCCYADSWASVPFQRMPNISLLPSPAPATLAELVGGVEDGILIDGRGSFSIDQQRYNFQFGGDAFWAIKHGRVAGMLSDVAYQSRTPDFWQACDAIGGEKTWENVGLNNDGKGEPMQLNAMSHGCPPARIRRVNVLRTA